VKLGDAVFSRPERQSEDHRRLGARQGSSCRNLGTETISSVRVCSAGQGAAHLDGRDHDGLRHRATGKSAIVRVLHEGTNISPNCSCASLSRNIRVEADLVDQLFNSSEKRLARMLLLLANFGKESKPEPIIAKISQETSSRDDSERTRLRVSSS